jgi:predicted nucleotidyltransferase
MLAGPGFEDAFFTRITRHSIDGVEVPVADVTDLVVMKVFAGRPKDVEDVITLLRVQHDRIDVDRARAALQQLEAALGQSNLLPVLEEVLTRARQRRL